MQIVHVCMLFLLFTGKLCDSVACAIRRKIQHHITMVSLQCHVQKRSAIHALCWQRSWSNSSPLLVKYGLRLPPVLAITAVTSLLASWIVVLSTQWISCIRKRYLTRIFLNRPSPEPGPLLAILIQETPYYKKKNSLENFRSWKLNHENRKSFPPQMICIIRYILSGMQYWIKYLLYIYMLWISWITSIKNATCAI